MNPLWLKSLLGVVPAVLKDNKGKLSSKRTVSGVFAIACASQIAVVGITTNVLLLALISVIPICFSVFEKK